MSISHFPDAVIIHQDQKKLVEEGVIGVYGPRGMGLEFIIAVGLEQQRKAERRCLQP